MNLGGFAFVLATVIAGGSGGAHMTAQHEPTALTQPGTGGSLSPVGTTGILTQAGAQTWQAQVLMDDSMPDCAASAVPTVYQLQYTVPGHPGKAQLQGTPKPKPTPLTFKPPVQSASSCAFTITFNGLAQVPVTATLDVDQGGSSTAITLTVSRTVTLYYYLGLPAMVGGAMAVIMLPLAIWLVELYDEKGCPLRRRTADYWARPLVAAGAWSLNDSWATNITALTTLLTTVLGVSTATAALFPGVSVDRFVVVNIVAGGIVAVAPLAFGVLYAIWTRRNPGVMADAALVLPPAKTVELPRRSTLRLSAATKVLRASGRTRPLAAGTEITLARATRIVLGAGRTTSLAAGVDATVPAGAVARPSPSATFMAGPGGMQGPTLTAETAIRLPDGASVTMRAVTVDLPGDGSAVLTDDGVVELLLPARAAIPDGQEGILPKATRLTLPRGAAVNPPPLVTILGRSARVRVPRTAVARFRMLPWPARVTVKDDVTATPGARAAARLADAAQLPDAAKLPAAVITLQSGADMVLPGGATVTALEDPAQPAVQVRFGHTVHVPPRTCVSVQAGAVMTVPGTSDITVNAQSILVIHAGAGGLAIASDDIVPPRGGKAADATPRYPVRILAAGGAKMTVAGTADLTLPAGTVSKAPYRTDLPLPRKRSLQVPQGTSTLFGTLRMILATAVITMFGIGAEIGIAAVLAFDLSEASQVWRSVMLGVIVVVAVLVMAYAVTAIRAIADPRPGSSISAASGTSFTL